MKLAEHIFSKVDDLEKIELCGLCSDICIISNATLIKAFCPEIKIEIDSKCVAGVTIDSNNKALDTMKMLQIKIN